MNICLLKQVEVKRNFIVRLFSIIENNNVIIN